MMSTQIIKFILLTFWRVTTTVRCYWRNNTRKCSKRQWESNELRTFEVEDVSNARTILINVYNQNSLSRPITVSQCIYRIWNQPRHFYLTRKNVLQIDHTMVPYLTFHTTQCTVATDSTKCSSFASDNKMGKNSSQRRNERHSVHHLSTQQIIYFVGIHP